MSLPFVGAPTTSHGGCAYSADLDSPACGQPCTVHLAVRSAAWGVVALASCDPHAPTARASGELLAEHPHRPDCQSMDCWAGVA